MSSEGPPYLVDSYKQVVLRINSNPDPHGTKTITEKGSHRTEMTQTDVVLAINQCISIWDLDNHAVCTARPYHPCHDVAHMHESTELLME